MKRKITTATLAAGLAFAAYALPAARAEEDSRQWIKADPATVSALMKEMRGLTERLDDILAALAEGDFKSAARIAEIHLGFGHKKLEAMQAAGKSDAEIDQMRAFIRKKRAELEARGLSMRGRGEAFGLKPGPGAKLPEDFHAMGQAMHDAAEQMALAARAAGDKPGVEDYKKVLGRLQEMTNTCRSCHSAFRVR